MNMGALVEGLKSVIVRSLTSPSGSNQVTPLSMILAGGVAGISLILAEFFWGYLCTKRCVSIMDVAKAFPC